ncbi:carbohydrate ABC transporter permease [Paenibacillus sp. FSL H8-0034]|uniref:carbohydrate ABC transporter permease n=1 Tax=Paenibacillus sp. FSL H8-0034 TaxID=2954671 RepID=UPI0030FB1685
MSESSGDKILRMFNILLLFVIAMTCLAPVLNVLSISLSGKLAVESGKVLLWPIDWNLQSYSLLFNGTRIARALWNGIEMTVGGVVFSMVFTICAAYPLSKSYFFGRRTYTLLIIFTMVFSGGLIPTYLTLKSLGLINTYAAIWLPGLISTYNMLIMRSYFESISMEIEDAARIDGCNEWRLLQKIILPLSMPVIATLILFYGVHYWNSFMSVLIYISSTDKYTITVLVQQMIQSQSLLTETVQNDMQTGDIVPQGILSAGIIVLILPMVAVYPFLQKYFVKGVMLGSVKG